MHLDLLVGGGDKSAIYITILQCAHSAAKLITIALMLKSMAPQNRIRMSHDVDIELMHDL